MKKVLFCLLTILICCVVLASCTEEELGFKQDPEGTTLIQDGVIGDDAVYVYTMQGISKYSYNNGRLDSITVLDTTTLNSNHVNPDLYNCKYTYNSAGYIDSLVYMGNEFTVSENDDAGRPISAVAETAFSDLEVEFEYSDNGKIIKETFYENGKVNLINYFNSLSRPEKIEYVGDASVEYEYMGNKIYVYVKFDDESKSAPDTTMYYDKEGRLKHFTQNAESAFSTTTWYYDKKDRCTNSVIESYSDNKILVEEYLIKYDDKGLTEFVSYYTRVDDEPILSSEFSFKYKSQILISQNEVIYKDGAILSVSTYEYSNGNNVKAVTETYTDGVVSEITILTNEFNEHSKLLKTSEENYIGEAYSSGNLKTLEYNEKGYNTSSQTISYGENKSVLYTFIEEYEYDSMGNNIKALYIAYDTDNKLKEKECDEFEYDEENRITLQRVTMYSSDDVVTGSTETKTSYSITGDIRQIVTTVYDGEGNVVNRTIDKK